MKNKYIIFFEGVDCVGKTTIAKALACALNCSYFKNFLEKDRLKAEFAKIEKAELNSLYRFNEAEYLLQLLKQVTFYKNGIIFDRHLPSEYAYAKTFKRKTDISRIFNLDVQFAKLNTKIIYCYKTYIYNYDDIVDKNKIRLLEKYYDEYFRKTKMDFLKLDTTDEKLINQILVIFNWLEEN